MDVSSLSNIASTYMQDALQGSSAIVTEEAEFGSILQSAVDMLNETNDLQNQAESAEIEFALGYSTNTHDLTIAQEKASVALQYTVAVRDKVVEAYKEIMNMQI